MACTPCSWNHSGKSNFAEQCNHPHSEAYNGFQRLVTPHMQHPLRCLSAFFLAFSSLACSRPHKDTRSDEPVVPADKNLIFTDFQVNVPEHNGVCGKNRIEVEGDFCTNALETCLTWVKNPVGNKVCSEFKAPTVCTGRKVHMHYCIDEYEYPDVPGERPKSWMSWYDAENACTARGERLCEDNEWTFACEGPDMQPYPYGDGYHRDSTACNFDNPMPAGFSVFASKRPGDAASQVLDNMLVPAGSMERCVSPFGMHDAVGNIDEWMAHTYVSQSGRKYAHLKSGHVFGVRNACRPVTDGHGPTFSWYETGTRCCLDIK